MTALSDHLPGVDSTGAPTTGAGTATPVVEIAVLGRFELTIAGRDVARHLRRRDAARLAKYLALAPGRRVHREQLVDALWPEAPFGAAGNRLHKAAHFLRRATGLADGVVLSGDTVALLPGARVRTDVHAFEALADEGLANADADAIDRAIALYRGDLLPHDLYEPWLDYNRHRLRGRLCRLLRASGRFERLVAVDPTDEDGHVGIMRAMVRDGDLTGVLHQYALLSRVLDEALGVQPGPEARALRGLALTAPVADPPRPTSPAGDVTRD